MVQPLVDMLVFELEEEAEEAEAEVEVVEVKNVHLHHHCCHLLHLLPHLTFQFGCETASQTEILVEAVVVAAVAVKVNIER